MLLRAQLRAFVAGQFRLLNIAPQQVFENRTLPMDAERLKTNGPMVILTTPREQKASVGPGAPKFTTTITLRVDATLTESDAETATTAIELLMERIELAVLANTAVMQLIQEVVGVDTETKIDTEGNLPIARGAIAFHIVLPQTYDPAMPDRLAELDIFLDQQAFANPDLNLPGIVKATLPTI